MGEYPIKDDSNFNVIFSCVFVTFPYDVLGKVWCLIVSIPDLCLLPYFSQFLTDNVLSVKLCFFLPITLQICFK